MKNNIRNHRGGALSLVETLTVIAIMALLAVFTIPAHATIVLFDGTTITNNNAPLYSGTNTSGVYTNNYQTGTVPGASNVLYQLSKTLGDQPGKGTNGYLPALGINLQGGFPGSLTAPSRYLSIEVSGSLMATNATSTAVVFQFAATDSGKAWQTNWITMPFTIPVNNTSVAGGVFLTNVDAGAIGFVGLQQINNPGVAALTNIVIQFNSKPGL